MTRECEMQATHKTNERMRWKNSRRTKCCAKTSQRSCNNNSVPSERREYNGNDAAHERDVSFSAERVQSGNESDGTEIRRKTYRRRLLERNNSAENISSKIHILTSSQTDSKTQCRFILFQALTLYPEGRHRLFLRKQHHWCETLAFIDSASNELISEKYLGSPWRRWPTDGPRKASSTSPCTCTYTWWDFRLRRWQDLTQYFHSISMDGACVCMSSGMTHRHSSISTYRNRWPQLSATSIDNFEWWIWC